MPLADYLTLSAILFVLGTVGVLTRHNPLVMFMSIELMWNAVNLTFIAFSRGLLDVTGQVFVFLVVTVAAAEVAIGLAIIVLAFRHREQVDVDQLSMLKG